MIILDNSLFSGLALLITAIVAFLTYKTRQTSEVNKLNLGGAEAAIDGLAQLAKQHTAEIARIRKIHDDYVSKCEFDKSEFMRQLAKHEGQIDILKRNIVTDNQETGKAK